MASTMLDSLVAQSDSAVVAAVDRIVLAVETNPSTLISPSANLASRWPGRVLSLLQSKTVESRKVGVRLVHLTAQYSLSLLSDNLDAWSGLLLNYLKTQRSDLQQLHIEAVRASAAIYGACARIPSLKRDALAGNFSKWVTANLDLLEHHPDNNLQTAILQSIEHLLHSYKTSFRPFHDRLQSLLVPLLNEGNVDACRCLVSLVLCGTVKGSANSDEQQQQQQQQLSPWTKLTQHALGTAHQLLNLLFNFIDEEDGKEHKRENSVPFWPVLLEDVDASASRVAAATTRVHTIFTLISYALSCPAPAAVFVPIDALARLISRLLAVHKTTPTLHNPDASAVQFVRLQLPSLHRQAARLTMALLHCLGDQMLPWTSFIAQVCWQLTAKDSSCSERSIGFDLITLALQHFGQGFISSSLRDFGNMILAEATFSSGLLTLSDSSSTTPTTSRKSLKRRAAAAEDAEIDDVAPEILMCSCVASSAFKALYGFVEASCHSPLGPRTEIDRFLVTTLLRETSHPSRSSRLDDRPCSHSMPERESITLDQLLTCLYRSLTITALASGSRVQASILPYALRIIKEGKHHPLEQVRLYCRLASNLFLPMLHPSLPPLYRYAQNDFELVPKQTITIEQQPQQLPPIQPVQPVQQNSVIAAHEPLTASESSMFAQVTSSPAASLTSVNVQSFLAPSPLFQAQTVAKPGLSEEKTQPVDQFQTTSSAELTLETESQVKLLEQTNSATSSKPKLDVAYSAREQMDVDSDGESLPKIVDEDPDSDDV